MMRIRLITIGAVKTSTLAAAASLYSERIEHDAQYEILELPASKQKDPEKQREEECARLLEKLEKTHGVVWVLDERGKGMTSEKFAEELTKISDRGEEVTFVLGGAYGLNDAVRSKAHTVLRLSDMTFPHELCRVVFLEQLYRALQIQKGSGYHH